MPVWKEAVKTLRSDSPLPLSRPNFPEHYVSVETWHSYITEVAASHRVWREAEAPRWSASAFFNQTWQTQQSKGNEIFNRSTWGHMPVPHQRGASNMLGQEFWKYGRAQKKTAAFPYARHWSFFCFCFLHVTQKTVSIQGIWNAWILYPLPPHSTNLNFCGAKFNSAFQHLQHFVRRFGRSAAPLIPRMPSRTPVSMFVFGIIGFTGF